MYREVVPPNNGFAELHPPKQPIKHHDAGLVEQIKAENLALEPARLAQGAVPFVEVTAFMPNRVLHLLDNLHFQTFTGVMAFYERGVYPRRWGKKTIKAFEHTMSINRQLLTSWGDLDPTR